MALFPPNVRPKFGYQRRSKFGALVIPLGGGKRQVREHLGDPLFWAQATFALNQADLAEVEAFVEGVRGPALTFGFYDYDPWRVNVDLPIGTADGSTRHFAAPLTDPDPEYAHILTVGGSAYTLGTQWWIGVENRIVYSEDLSQTGTWVAGSGATVTRTGAQTDPLGGSTAWRVQSSGGSTATKLQQAVGTPAIGQRSRLSVWVRNAGSVTVTVTDGITSATLAAGSGWTEIVLDTSGDGGPQTLSLQVPSASDALDVYVWHPWVAWWNSLWGYPTYRWGYLPTHSAAVTADTALRKAWIGFLSAPASGAILATLAGRRYYESVALVGDPAVVSVSGYKSYGYQLELEEVL